MSVLGGIAVLSSLLFIPVALWLSGVILLWTMKVFLFFMIIIFGIIPVIFRYTYPLQRSVIFLNFVNYTPNTDFKSPEKFGLQNARNFYVKTDDGVSIGIWHILPDSLAVGNSSAQHNDSYYEDALSHGEPVIVYMHGNSGSRASGHRVDLYRLLQKLNYHIIAFDYRSYGDSSPVSPSEMGVVADGAFVIKWVKQRMNSAPLFVWGHSLGTGVSAHVLDLMAREGIHAKGLILEAPFNNLRDEIKEHPFTKIFRYLPWFDFFIVDPISDNKLLFETDKHLLVIQSPILILHAEDDLIIPFHLAKKLYTTQLEQRSKLFGRIDLIKFEGKHKFGHKYIFKAPELPEIISKFVNDNKSY